MKNKKIRAIILLTFAIIFLMLAISLFIVQIFIKSYIKYLLILLAFILFDTCIPFFITGCIQSNLAIKEYYRKNAKKSYAIIKEYSKSMKNRAMIYYMRVVYVDEANCQHSKTIRIHENEFNYYPLETKIECLVKGQNCIIDGIKVID